jgi:ribonuclease BN (tRNA processing enzyme)
MPRARAITKGLRNVSRVAAGERVVEQLRLRFLRAEIARRVERFSFHHQSSNSPASAFAQVTVNHIHADFQSKIPQFFRFSSLCHYTRRLLFNS